ncbi:MAG: diguanylate cyclase [Deltaproteobacteria bacterium]|nr:MAG: diguanylate cyclase [Deltaproteobacteria bacterium]
MCVSHPPAASAAQRRYNRLLVLSRIRRSLALKLILASAIPSALVLLIGLGALVAHSHGIALRNPARAFDELRTGAILGTLLALTFAGMTIALAARHFLLKPIQALSRVMARAELGEFLVRARVQTEDELGRLARSFNTMLSRITDMAVTDIETRASMARMERDLSLQAELQAVNERLGAHVGEMELLLEVSNAISGTLDLPELLATLGRQVCARFGVSEFSVMLLDDATDQLVVEAVAGDAPRNARGMHFHLGEGITGEVAARGQTVYVKDVAKDPRSAPLRSKGRILGVMNLNRPREDDFSAQEIRLAEAIGAQAALAIANARLYQQTLELSFTDPLTGVPNRRQLFLRLENELSRSLRFGDPLSVLMIDLDLFKRINDAHGHSVGDGVLRGVALALRRTIRKIDVVARYGGEEFCVVLPRVAKPEAFEVAEKLRRAVAATTVPGPEGHPALSVTISVGVATLDTDAQDVVGLIDKADSALYEAKRLGRDRVSMATPLHRASA